MTIAEVLQHDKRFRYMLLDRLRLDCLYYLDNGCNPSRLWAGNPTDQIAYMRAIWNSFPKGEKPKWLSKAKIDKLAADMERQSV